MSSWGWVPGAYSIAKQKKRDAVSTNKKLATIAMDSNKLSVGVSDSMLQKLRRFVINLIFVKRPDFKGIINSVHYV